VGIFPPILIKRNYIFIVFLLNKTIGGGFGKTKNLRREM